MDDNKTNTNNAKQMHNEYHVPINEDKSNTSDIKEIHKKLMPKEYTKISHA